MPAPVMLSPNDIVTKRCREGHPMTFVRDFGTGGQAVATPLMADGVPLCSVCLTDEQLLQLTQAGVIVEFDS